MIQKLSYTVILLFLAFSQLQAQRTLSRRSPDKSASTGHAKGEDSHGHEHDEKKKAIPSVIRVWQVTDHGAFLNHAELDTTLNFYHDYLPFNKRSFSNTFTGNNGGAYISNDFFSREPKSDFYFYRSFDAYTLLPSDIQYMNTTTPYTLLDYMQSENRQTKNETRFNVSHSQNINEKLNVSFIYNQTRSMGHYENQENSFHSIGFFSSYNSDKFISHSTILFNRLKTEENGGLEANQDLSKEILNFNISDARSKLQNNTIYSVNEYRLGKVVEENDKKDKDYVVEKFIPRTGFAYEFELSGNERDFYKDALTDKFFTNIYLNKEKTADATNYTRLTNIFQLKFYEAPDRKYTFGKHAFIGNDQIWYKYPVISNSSNELVFNVDGNYNISNGPFIIQGYQWDIIPSVQFRYDRKQTNTFVGGAIYRKEGKFWQWNASGKLYLAGYRAGQTELEGYINKPLRIGSDTTSLRIEGSLKTIVPDYFQQNYFANHYRWRNNFNNMNEMIVRGQIHSQKYKTTLGVNYALIDNYIYNNANTLPEQADGELLVMSAFLNNDLESKHWVMRSRILWQSASNENYVHLPDLAAYLSLSYKTILSKVMHVRIGADARYTTAFYADAYELSTARYYWQDKQKIGNYPFLDLHVNLKLKRTRAFFNFMNVLALVDNKFLTAPSYPLFKQTYRIGIAWSFYN